MRSIARSLGAGVELHYLQASAEELWRRIETRNSAPPWDSHPIHRWHLDHWQSLFEAPEAAELAFVRPPDESGG